MFQNESQSYYEILDVKPDASQSEIRQAYLRTKAAYSKDSAALYSIFDEHETRKVLESIEQAYLVLSSPEKRKEYDRVHGLLQGSGHQINVKKSSTAPNSYSFATMASTTPDPAQQAAAAVFGMNASDLGGSQNEKPATPNVAQAPAATRATAPTHEDYATPRTLEASNLSSSPIEEYTSRTGFNTSENRLGIVRRIDLGKPYERNSEMEETISREIDYRGEFFRKVREYKCLTLEELAEFTKISKTYLNCIESEEFESLPAPAYLRGFVLQFAKALKLPHDKAAQAYMDYYKKTVLK